MAKLPWVRRTPIIRSVSPEKQPIGFYVTFRYTSGSLIINLLQLAYDTRLDRTYGSVAKGSKVIW
jgi:hypothetical protein